MTDQVGRTVMPLPKGVLNLNLAARPVLLPAPITYPIKLSAKAQFVGGVAALVFVSPHVLDASQDHAEFGLRIHHPEAADVGDRYEFIPPHSGARLVAWFRVTDANQKYLIEFTGAGIGSFTLIDGAGGSEVGQPAAAGKDNWGVARAQVARTFEGRSEWRWFSLENDNWWEVTACEIRKV